MIAQKFFENTAGSQFIKNIVANFPLPIIPTTATGDYIIKNNYYVFVNRIIKCTGSGIIGKTGSYDVLQSYDFGRRYPQFTTTYMANEKYYDPCVHEHLGNFLRGLRDTKYINLMPYYNCFSAKTIRGSLVERDEGIKYVPQIDTKTKLFAVPIRFNKEYTIAIDSFGPIWLLPILYNKSGEIKDSELNPYLDIKATTYSKLEYKNPVIYSVSTQGLDNEEDLGHMEKYLYLLIQFPSTVKSSVTILEGNYIDSSISEKYYDMSSITPIQENEVFLYNLSLLALNDKNTYAFSERLIEALLLHVINSEEDFWQNIRRVQDMAEMTRLKGYIPNVWTTEMRSAFFKAYLNPNYKDGTLKFDVDGFVDHRVEKMLLKGALKV